MTQRSTFKSAEYWKENLSYLAKSVRQYEKMARDDKGDPELRERGRRMAWSRQLDLIRAHYSAGSPIAKLPPLYAELVEHISDYLDDPARLTFELSDIDHYVRVISMLALGILLRANDKQLAPVLEFAGKPGQDAFFDQLAARPPAGKRAMPPKLAHPKPFALLERALVAKDSNAAADALIEFLQKYYAGIKNTYFYNTHLKGDAGFVGYWSFEAALVAVVKDIDDSAIADNPYYPADLVAYAR